MRQWQVWRGLGSRARAGILPLVLGLVVALSAVQPVAAQAAACFVSPAAPVPPEISVDGIPAAVASGDFNGDGKLDVLTATGTLVAGTVSVRLGTGTGAFTNGTSVNVGANPSGLAVGDFNNDGKLDFVTANLGAQNVSVRLGNGQGGFTSPSTPEVSIGGLPIAIAVADMNKDGKLDFVTGNFTSSSVSVRLGNGQGLFNPTSTPETPLPGKVIFTVVVGNFTNDHNPDVVTGNDESFTHLSGDGAGLLLAPATVDVGLGIRSVARGDFNGDNSQDLVISHTDANTVTIFYGTGEGGFLWANLTLVGANPRGAVTGDFNGDSKLDFAVANFGANTVSVWLGNGNFGFTPAPDVPVGGGPTALVVGLFDADNAPDLVVANKSTLNVSIRKNACTSNVPPAISAPSSQAMPEDGVLVFSSAANNVVSVSDADGGATALEVQLAVSKGTLTLGGSAGLTFTSGDGAQDRAMAFRGTVSTVNAALNGLSFRPERDSVDTVQLTMNLIDSPPPGTDGPKTASTTVTISVTPVNDPPTAANEQYIVAAQIPLTVPSAGLLANDTDSDSSASALTAILVTGPKHGTLQLNPNGGFTYTSNSGFVGTDTFTYRASDGALTSNAATVTLTVTTLGCSPRPKVQPTPTGGKLQVYVEVTAITGPLPNALLTLQFGAFQNAKVTVNGQPIESGKPMKPAMGVTSLTFTVERLDQSKATHVPFTIVDGCGEWQTFVGGGVGAGF